MVPSFSTPILSVAADAVRDLDGHDALFGLWTIFTKCKESLPHGARLENITWRLWHRELHGFVLEKALITKERELAATTGLDEKSLYPSPTASSMNFPSSEYSIAPEDVVRSFSEVLSPPSYSLSPPPCCPWSMSEAIQPPSKTRFSGRVGQTIADFLLSSNMQQSSLILTPDVSSGSSEGSATTHQSKPAVVACDVTRPSAISLPEAPSLVSCLPTPDAEVGELGPPISRTATQSPLPLLHESPEPYPTSALLSEPPRLVIVNPTPSLTPHPTPPTTPLVTSTANPTQGTRSVWLAPPRSTRGSVWKMYGEQAAVQDSGVTFDSTDSLMRKDGTAVIRTRRSDRDLAGDLADRRSVSSVTSKSSEWSHTTTTTSATGASTTSASSTGYLQDEGGKASDLIGTVMGCTHLPLANLQRMGSLSTIQSISTDRGRKEAMRSSDVKDSGSGVVTAAEDEGETADPEVLKKGDLSSRSRATSKKQAKRNSAPVSLTTNLATHTTSHVDHSAHHSPVVPLSAEHPTTPESTSERVTNSNSAMNHDRSNDRNSSQSRSRDGSSVKGSRSRSGDRSGNLFADLSGIGTLGGYTIAAAYPPPNMTVRKQVAVGASKGKVKVAFGRGHNGKSKAVRRNSAGSTLDVGAKDKHGSGTKLERVESVEHQSHLEEILEKPTLGQPLDQPQVTLLEDKILQDSTSTSAAKRQRLATTDAVPKRHADLLTVGEPMQTFKRQTRFNIGSNSDDGSGLGSKSAGSGSSFSGGHSLGQRAGKMMEDSQRQEARAHVMNEKLDTLLLEEQQRQRRMGDPKEEVQRSAKQLPKHQNAHGELPALLHKPAKQEIRHSKATQLVTRGGLERVQSSGRVSEKGRGMAKAIHGDSMPPPTSKHSSKTKSKSTPNLGSLDPVLAAKVRDSPNEPLLPKGRPVVVDSDSEYETDTEDGSWSDEDDTEAQKQEQTKQELALQQERERLEAERQQQELLLHQMHLQQHHQHHTGRPTGVQRTHSSHYPAPNNARTTKGIAQRNRHQQIRELALHHAKLEQAAKEAQRQRDMIKKLPRESFQDLAKARANSVGLLTQLLKPDPEIFPPSHPYRRGYSSGAIQPMALAPMAPMQPTTSDPGPSNSNIVEKLAPNDNPQQSRPAPQIEATRPPPRRHMSTDEGKRRMPSLSKITSPIRGPLQFTKSSAAMPVSSQVQVGSVGTKAPSVAVSSGVFGSNPTMTGSGGFRPKGPPKDQEMEEDSDSEPETGKIQMSKSIAEQKLKALAQKRGIRQQPAVAQPPPKAASSKVGPLADEEVPDWVRVSQPGHQQERQWRTLAGPPVLPISRPPPSAPIPLGHPYNLPPPPPPTTPRTTRRQMLSTELSESLRRNLLWERQVSKNNLAAMRRSSSGGLNRHDGLSRLQPFTSIAPVVQLHAKGTIPLEQQEDPAKHVAMPSTEAEREEMRRHAMARNRSWANEFHYAGW